MGKSKSLEDILKGWNGNGWVFDVTNMVDGRNVWRVNLGYLEQGHDSSHKFVLVEGNDLMRTCLKADEVAARCGKKLMKAAICHACGHACRRRRLKKSYRPTDQEPYFVCPKCGSEDVSEIWVNEGADIQGVGMDGCIIPCQPTHEG